MNNRYNFHRKHIAENQSLKYQIMLLLMEEHKRARLGINYIGTYNGDDYISFDIFQWKQMCEIIQEFVTQNHKNILFDYKSSLDDFIFGLIQSKNELYTFVDDSSMNIKFFHLTSNGYSYQFNNYMRSQDRANQINITIQKYMMYFSLGALVYTILNLIKKDITINDILDYTFNFKSIYVLYIIQTLMLISLTLVFIKTIKTIFFYIVEKIKY